MRSKAAWLVVPAIAALLCASSAVAQITQGRLTGVVTDAQGNDSIAIRSLVHLTLGYDRRAVDGAVADQFMALVKKTLENWSEEVG